MKKQILLPLLAAIIALPLHAQAVKESDLTPEEKTLLTAVRSKASSDTSVKQATDAIRTTKIELISKADPSLQPFAPKILVSAPATPNDLSADEKAKWGPVDVKVKNLPAVWKASDALMKLRIEEVIKIDPSLESAAKKIYVVPSMPLTALTPEEKAKWDAALKNVNNDPAVKQANENLVKAKNDAMLKIDPNVKPILDKLSAPAQ
jgi:hypothetical protein